METAKKGSNNRNFHNFFNKNDIEFAKTLEFEQFLSNTVCELDVDFDVVMVHDPIGEFAFLHETAVIEYKGVLYASWYNCIKVELEGYTPICSRRSFDGGKTWSELEIICEDKSGKILYCPPVYGIQDDKLYMFVNQMVSADHMHALDLYVLNNDTDKFEFVWSKPIPFKVNTNVVSLPNGKLMLPGRIAAMDSFPNTPAVLISDSGKIDGEWRLVRAWYTPNLRLCVLKVPYICLAVMTILKFRLCTYLTTLAKLGVICAPMISLIYLQKYIRANLAITVNT